MWFWVSRQRNRKLTKQTMKTLLAVKKASINNLLSGTQVFYTQVRATATTNQTVVCVVLAMAYWVCAVCYRVASSSFSTQFPLRCSTTRTERRFLKEQWAKRPHVRWSSTFATDAKNGQPNHTCRTCASELLLLGSSLLCSLVVEPSVCHLFSVVLVLLQYYCSVRKTNV